MVLNDPDCQVCQPGDPMCSDGICTEDPVDPDCVFACMSDADCAPGEACLNGACVCLGDGCPDGVCDKNVPNDPDCPPPPPVMCKKNADCGDGQKCVMGQCL